MNSLIEKHRPHWKHRPFSISVFLGFVWLAASLAINYAAAMYATTHAGPAVTDIVLDNIPVFNVDIIFLDGALIFVLFLIGVLMYYPKFIPYVLKSTALFFLIRSFSITLTHIGPSPEQSPLVLNSLNKIFVFGGDLFFSGHTGLPFLMALIFWKNKALRYSFLFASMVAGVSVLLGHLHYSIDVFAAFFITYGIFHMTREFFRKDFEYADKFL